MYLKYVCEKNLNIAKCFLVKKMERYVRVTKYRTSFVTCFYLFFLTDTKSKTNVA